jgi:hypothetical protein
MVIFFGLIAAVLYSTRLLGRPAQAFYQTMAILLA